MKRAEELYHRSLALIGEVPGGENELFRERAIPLMNVLLSQLYELDMALRGGKLCPGAIIPQVRDLEDLLPFSEAILYTVLPLGLAGLLLMEEEAERGRFFLQLYHTEVEILRDRCKRGIRHKIRRSV